MAIMNNHIGWDDITKIKKRIDDTNDLWTIYVIFDVLVNNKNINISDRHIYDKIELSKQMKKFIEEL